MIASLTGRLTRKATDSLVVDVAGVGYQVFVPLSTYYGIPAQGEEVSLHIYTHVREDALTLFGFLNPAEKDAFIQLLSVSGIGPKLALAVLSSLSVEDLVCAISGSDDSRLCSIPGIGKKTAARLVLELKDRMKNISVDAASSTSSAGSGSRDTDDAVSALMNLGYKKPAAEEAVKRTIAGRSGMALETVIREALRELVKR